MGGVAGMAAQTDLLMRWIRFMFLKACASNHVCAEALPCARLALMHAPRACSREFCNNILFNPHTRSDTLPLQQCNRDKLRQTATQTTEREMAVTLLRPQLASSLI